MEQTKSILQSRTVWGAIVALIGVVLNLFGVSFPTSEQATFVDHIVGAMPHIMEIVGIALAIWGRLKATTTVTLTGQPPKVS